MRASIFSLLLLGLCLAPACGGGAGPTPEAFTHPLLVGANVYGAPDPEGAEALTPAEFAALVDSGEYELVTAAARAAAAEQAQAEAAQDRATAYSVYANSPELLQRMERNIPADDPDFRVLGNGNVETRIDGVGGVGPIQFQLDGPHISDRELVKAKLDYETKATQLATYEQLYDLVDENYRLLRALPKPQDVQGEDYDYFLSLNDAIKADWQMFYQPAGPKPAPAGYPASWRDEEGAGTLLTPALGLDRAGPEGLPVGLWAEVDFPLKWCATRVRHQGRRGTCVFFSITAAMEARYAALHARWVNLSEQFFYNQARKVWIPSNWGDSSWPLITIPNMQAHGFIFPYEFRWDYNQCPQRIDDADTMTYTRSCWADAAGNPYLGTFCSDTNHQSPMICTRLGPLLFCATRDPAPFIANDSGIGLVSAPVISHFTTRVTNHALAKVMLSLKIPLVYCYDVPERTFFTPGGLLPFDPTDTVIVGAHCSVILGYVGNADLPVGTPPGSGGGYYIIKNSWGTDYGDMGYFYAPDDWVAKYLISMYAVTRVSG